MFNFNADNKWNIADRLEATVRYGVITGGDKYERQIAEQQVMNAVKFIRELYDDHQRLSYEIEALSGQIDILEKELKNGKH